MPDMDYGTRKMIYSRKRKDMNADRTGLDASWTDAPPATPLFILCNDKNGMLQDHFEAKKCYCSDCNELFDLSVEADDASPRILRFQDRRRSAGAFLPPREFRQAVEQADIACPSCKKPADSEMVYVAAIPQTETEAGTWNLPSLLQGRYVSAFYGKDAKATRIDDTMIMEHTKIHPSGDIETRTSETSQTMDFLTGRILSYRTDITDGKRTPVGKAMEVANPFRYTDTSFSMEGRINVLCVSNVSSTCETRTDDMHVQNFKDGVFGRLFTDHYDPGVTRESISFLSKEVTDLKVKLAMERLDVLGTHPVYRNRDDLFLMEHKKDSTVENTPTDHLRMNLYLYMMTRYPAAVELAVSKAELRVANFEFAEKRKAAERPDYTAKTATDKARAKFFREEMNSVAEQLTACDDKILNEIRLASMPGPSYVYQDGKIQKTDRYESPDGRTTDLQKMKDRLSFFVFGLRDGYTVPGDIAVKLKNAKTASPATAATKKFRNSFQADPVAMASNVYTLRKYGITNSDHVKQVLDLTNEQAAPVKSKKGLRPRKCPFMNNGVLAPVRDRTVLSFLRLYAKTHDTSAMISHIFDHRGLKTWEKWSELTEDIRLYGDIADNPKIKIIRTRDDIVTTADSVVTEDEKKTQLRNYLDNSGENGIAEAYRDFACIYGEHTVETVNALARQIKTDRKMDEIKRFAGENGMERAMETYADFLSRYEDPEEAITAHQLFSDRTLVIATRNNKPLFERDLKGIHDELSEISKKSVKENEYLTLSDEALSMNRTIPVNLADLPDSQWGVPRAEGMGEFSFHVLDNRFDFVRVATDLRNCVAGASYFNNVKTGNKLIVSMRNEKNQTCACIELVRNRDDDGHRWYMNQLQGLRDGVVDARYGPVIKEWAQDHFIDLDRDPSDNVSACMNGEARYFYGEGEADLHQEEFDPVLNTTLNNRKAQSLREERIARACELYGGDPEHGPALPEVPEDLRY